MKRSESKSKRRRTVTSFEPLDNRVLLSSFAPTPPTPAPAPSPVSAAMVGRFEQRIDRVEHEFLTRAGRLTAMVAHRATKLEDRLEQANSIAQARLQQNALLSSRLTPQVVVLNQSQAVNNQLTSLVTTTSARLNQLNSSMLGKFSLFAVPFVASDAQLNTPAMAFQNDLRFAKFAFTTNVSNTVGSVAAQVQNQVSSLTSAVSKPSTTATSTTPSTTATSTTGSVGTTQTETFNNLFTQEASSINTAITGVNATLASDFASLTTALNSNVTALASTLSTSALGTFQPVSSFVTGNGVTFTSSTPSVSTIGTIGTSSIANG
jgi:hypothetical protein